MNLPIDDRSDSGLSVEQQKFNFELFIPSLERSDSVSTKVKQRSDIGTIAVRLLVLICPLSHWDLLLLLHFAVL